MSATQRAENFTSPGGEDRRQNAYLCRADRNPRSTTGASPGQMEGRRRIRHAGGGVRTASCIASMRAICIWCSVRPADGKPVRFRVSIDGAAPGASHGTDVAADGSGTVTGVRLYQLVRQSGDVEGSHLLDRVSGPRRRGLFIHVRLMPSAMSNRSNYPSLKGLTIVNTISSKVSSLRKRSRLAKLAGVVALAVGAIALQRVAVSAEAATQIPRACSGRESRRNP